VRDQNTNYKHQTQTTQNQKQQQNLKRNTHWQDTT
jgi:hypothetical protein